LGVSRSFGLSEAESLAKARDRVHALMEHGEDGDVLFVSNEEDEVVAAPGDEDV
jgi:hypothetical protein